MKRNARPFLTVLLIFASVAFVRSQHLNKESYEIYDAVIRTMFADDKVTFDLGGPKVSQFVIRDHTLTGFSHGDKKESWDVIVKPRFKQLSDDVIEGYELNAKASVGLERKFGTNLPYKLISEPELDAFLASRTRIGWTKNGRNFTRRILDRTAIFRFPTSDSTKLRTRL